MPRLLRWKPGRVGVFGVDLRQRDVRPAVVGPRFQLRQLVDRRLAIEHRARANFSRPRQQGRPGRLQIQPRPPHHIGRIDLERDELLQPFERIAEEVPRSGHRAEQVAEHREAAADDVGQQQGRPAGAKHAPLDFGRFEVRRRSARRSGRSCPVASRSSTHWRRLRYMGVVAVGNVLALGVACCTGLLPRGWQLAIVADGGFF